MLTRKFVEQTLTELSAPGVDGDAAVLALLHLYVAGSEGRTLPDLTEAEAAEIAAACRQAGLAGVAATWYQHAAQTTTDPDTALDYYRQAHALVPADDPEHFLAISHEFGDALRRRGHHAEAVPVLEAGRAAAAAAGNIAGQSRALDRLFLIHEAQGDFRAALDIADQAVGVAREGDAASRPALVNALYSKGWAAYRLGDNDTALAQGHEALSLARTLDAQLAILRSLNLLGSIYTTLSRYATAYEYYAQALAIAYNLGDQRLVGIMLGNIGETARARGDYSAALHLSRQALTIAQEIDDPAREASVLWKIGAAQVALGAYGEAEQALRQSASFSATMGDRVPQAFARVFLAGAYLGQEQYDAAQAAISEALRLGQPSESELWGTAWRVVGILAGQTGQAFQWDGQAHDAPACFGRSLEVLRAASMPAEQARTLRTWAMYAPAPGTPAPDPVCWAEARRLFLDLSLDLEVARMDAPPADGSPAVPFV